MTSGVLMCSERVATAKQKKGKKKDMHGVSTAKFRRVASRLMTRASAAGRPLTNAYNKEERNTVRNRGA